MVSIKRDDLVQVQEEILLGHYKNAKLLLDAVKKSDVKLTATEKIQSQLLLCNINQVQGHYKKCIQSAKKIFEKNMIAKDLVLSLEAISKIIHSLNQLDEIQDIRNWVKAGEEIAEKYDFEKNDDEKIVFSTFNMEKGAYFVKVGDFEEARIILQKSLILIKDVKKETLKAEILRSMGSLYLKQGNFDLAIEHYQQSLDIWEAVGNPFKIALIKNDLATILRIQGDIHLALAILQQELEAAMRFKNKQLHASIQLNIGLCYYELNRLTQTIDWLKLSMKNYKAAKNTRKIAENIYYLILAYIKDDQFKKTGKLFDQLVNLDNQINDLFINQWWLLTKALLLGESTRYSELGNSEEIFNFIINGKEIDQQVTVTAMLNLCKLQLNYLNKIEDFRLFEEVKINVLKLLSISILQDSYILSIETHLLDAQIAILAQDMDKAESVLSQARSLIQLKEIPRLSDEVTNFQEVLNTKLEVWEKLYRSNASLVDLLDLTPFEGSLKNIAQQRVTQKVYDENEDPILFIIQDPGGTSMFSKKFLPDSEFDEQLISAFLFAINNFMQETFEGKGSVDRITYLDYTLLFKPKDPFLVCYAYRGHSYSAQHNLDLFIDRFGTSLEIWQALLNYTETGLVPEIDVILVLEKLVDDIFSPYDMRTHDLMEEESIEDIMGDLLDSKL
ncbi:MAG: tetratricopeptide repeat protein [Asgard group archaeon]|nr:tetratricopeptide repeat protein [Asgard group archaeon]